MEWLLIPSFLLYKYYWKGENLYMQAVINVLLSGWQALVDYLTISRIIMLTIAFFWYI